MKEKMLSITEKSKISFLVQRAKSITVVDTISATVIFYFPCIPLSFLGKLCYTGGIFPMEVREMHIREHLKTVTRHRRLVRHYCFRLGLYWQGLTHDLSKYSPTEFWRSAKYYQGFRSPNDQERSETGVSLSWLHHKGRNRHHFEYWIDYRIGPDGTVTMGGCKMPKKYVAEMFCDRIAACRVYQGEKYTDASAYDYFHRTKGHLWINEETAALLDRWLLLLKEQGEDATLRQIRRELRASQVY